MHVRQLRPTTAALGILAMLASLVVASTPAHAAVDLVAVAGDNRYDTGIEVSQYAYPDAGAVDTVYLATGREAPDALAAGAAAAAAGGPLLLTGPDELYGPTRDELRRLKPSRVVVAGGEAALSNAVVNQVRSDGQIGAEVVRLGGTNRYETGAKVVLDAFPDGTDTLYVATGQDFPDALAGAPAAFRFDGPLLLVGTTSIPGPVEDAIEQLSPNRIVILGGTNAVEFEVESALRDMADEVDRQAGDNRYTTAVKVSEKAFAAARTVFVAYGQDFPDALTGGPAAAAAGGPLLLVGNETVPDEVASELLRLNPRTVVVLGGTSAVAQAARDRIRQVLSQGTALPGGATPDLVYNSIDNDTEAAQTTNVGTLDGAYEVLTNTPANFADVGAVFSPDGRRIAFLRGETGFLGGVSNAQIYVIDVAVGAASTRRLIDLERLDPDGGCQVGDLDWRADGNQLAFLCAGRSNDDGSLPNIAYVIDLRGRATEIPTTGTEAQEYIGVEYAPEGTTLVASAVDPDAADDAGYATLEEFDSADLGAGSSRLASIPQEGFLITALGTMEWSADGSTIVGTTASSSAADLMRVDVADGTVTELLDDDAEGPHQLAAVSADGSRALVITDPLEGSDILRLFDTSDGSVAATTVGPGDLSGTRIFGADLSPDGSTVVYGDVADDRRSGNVKLANPNGNNRRTVFEEANVTNANPRFNPVG